MLHTFSFYINKRRKSKNSMTHNWAKCGCYYCTVAQTVNMKMKPPQSMRHWNCQRTMNQFKGDFITKISSCSWLWLWHPAYDWTSYPASQLGKFSGWFWLALAVSSTHIIWCMMRISVQCWGYGGYRAYLWETKIQPICKAWEFSILQCQQNPMILKENYNDPYNDDTAFHLQK